MIIKGALFAVATGGLTGTAIHYFENGTRASAPVAAFASDKVASDDSAGATPAMIAHGSGSDAEMSAADLDSQQPSVAAYRPRRRAARTYMAASVSSYAVGMFRNCAQARAAGAAPLYRGQPGYGPHMDGDNDGIACESY